MAIKLISLNVNGIAEKRKRELIFDYLRTLKSDIYLLQETHKKTENDEIEWTREWGGLGLWRRGKHRSCGVGVLFRKGLDPNIITVKRDTEGRVIAVKVTVLETELNIVNVYAPNAPGTRKAFYTSLWSYVTNDTNMVLGGDFNCVPDTALDKLGGDPSNGAQGMKELLLFAKDHNLTDIWRAHHPTDKIYTWHNRDFTLRSRLDRFYVSRDTTTQSTSHIRACHLSDHNTVEISLVPACTIGRGRGTWKMNCNVIKDKLFQREMNAYLEY